MLKPRPPQPESLERTSIREFFLEARLAITKGRERFSVSIEWQHAPWEDDITVISPIGQTLARLGATPERAWLETIDQREFEAPNVEDLAEKILRFRLPLSGLPFWVLGRPSRPGTEGLRDVHGRWRVFEESGWRVTFVEYDGESRDALPAMIDLARGDISVRIKNDQWTFKP